jgi:8-oxo-dGTP pyrophosphatase MutT (NUDIX family)
MLACPSLDVFPPADAEPLLSRRVRAIVLVPQGGILFIKRVKPHNPVAYWVAPGGGMETEDINLYAALRRELHEELGARVDILGDAFVLRHQKGGKNLSLRSGPEFDDPTRGEYLPDEIDLSEEALNAVNIKTPELRDWLIENLPMLKELAAFVPPTQN